MHYSSPINLARPPFDARFIASFLRMTPTFRGRKRLEHIVGIENQFSNRGWSDIVSVRDFQLQVDIDDHIGRTLYLNGYWERSSTEALATVVRPDSIIFDVGANIGYFSLLLASLNGDSGKIYAFEPVSETYQRLQRNLHLNPHLQKRISVHQLALSNQQASLEINVATGSNRGASHITAGDSGDVGREKAGIAYTEKIVATTGDSFWEQIGSPQVDIIKMDIEGHEFHALQGMKKLISSSKNIIVFVEIRDRFLRATGGSDTKLFAYMHELGLKAFDFGIKHREWQENNLPHSRELVAFSRSKPTFYTPK